MPHPHHAPAERFAAIRRSLAQHRATRSRWGISAQVIALLIALIEEIERCFACLAARVEAGTDLPHPQAAPAGQASAAATQHAADQIPPAAAAGSGHSAPLATGAPDPRSRDGGAGADAPPAAVALPDAGVGPPPIPARPRRKPPARPQAAPQAGRDKPSRQPRKRTRPGFHEGLPPSTANSTPRKISGRSGPPPPHGHFVTITQQ